VGALDEAAVEQDRLERVEIGPRVPLDEMQQVRERVIGLYEQPVIPSWLTIIDSG
jgi:hypothetical protein